MRFIYLFYTRSDIKKIFTKLSDVDLWEIGLQITEIIIEFGIKTKISYDFFTKDNFDFDCGHAGVIVALLNE